MTVLRADVAGMLARIPGPRSGRWPDGERFAEAFRHGSLVVELYAPKDVDTQQPHDRDEVYVVVAGTGEFIVDGERSAFAAGDVLFVPAHAVHRFEKFGTDFVTWVMFYGPVGGESR